MTDIIQVPHFEQSTEGYCLPACGRMVLAYLGIERTEDEVSQALGTQEFGTPSFAIQRLSAWGLHVNLRPWSLSGLLSNLAAKQPMIVFVKTGFLDYWQEDFAHAIVVVGVTEDQRFWVNDPAQPSAPLIVSLDGLLAAWGEFDYRGAVLSHSSMSTKIVQQASRLAHLLRRVLFRGGPRGYPR